MAKNGDFGQIIAGCKKGRSECFSQLLELYSSRCYGYFYRLTGSPDVSDELLSELFVRLVEKIGSFKDGCFESWLFKIASNIFYDHLRDKHKQKKLIADQADELGHETEGIKSSNDEQIDNMQIQLGRLDIDTRELIMLRFYSQASFREIARMRDEPIGTTLSKLHRGLKKLRELME